MKTPVAEPVRNTPHPSDPSLSLEEKQPMGYLKLSKVTASSERKRRSPFSLMKEEKFEEESEQPFLFPPPSPHQTHAPSSSLTCDTSLLDVEEKEPFVEACEQGTFSPPCDVSLLEVEETEPLFEACDQGTLLQKGGEVPSPSPSTNIRTLSSAELDLLFETMASFMMIMDLEKETHTTLFLDSPHFASSWLFGTQITIKEFSTAPKAFNIEIFSSPAVVATIQQHQQGLLALFAHGNFNFIVHRLDTHLVCSTDPASTDPYQESPDQEEQQKDSRS